MGISLWAPISILLYGLSKSSQQTAIGISPSSPWGSTPTARRADDLLRIPVDQVRHPPTTIGRLRADLLAIRTTKAKWSPHGLCPFLRQCKELPVTWSKLLKLSTHEDEFSTITVDTTLDAQTHFAVSMIYPIAG